MFLNNKLLELKDLYRDKAIFIVGAGPSLHFQNTELLKDYVTISVNSGIVKVPWCDFFVSDDQDVRNWDYYINLLSQVFCKCLLYYDKLNKHAKHIDEKRIYWFDHKTWYEPSKKKYHSDGLVLTKDPLKPIIGARTSTGTAIHWAYIMGGNPIVLLGCDCCYKDMKRYFWQYKGENTPKRLDGKAIECRPSRKMNGHVIDYHSDDFIKYFSALANNCRDINIINASDGILDCFPKLSFDEVLERYRDKKKDKSPD